jgi:hypothetical protein
LLVIFATPRNNVFQPREVEVRVQQDVLSASGCH